MRRFAALTVSALALTVPVLGLSVSSAHADKDSADNGGKVCLPLNSGKIDVIGNQQTVTVKVPAGSLITGYCVKSGSVNNGNGPEYVTLVKPLQTVVIRHSSGKDVSHYSYSFGAPVEQPPAEEPPAELPPVVNPPTSTTGDFDWNWKYAAPACDALTVAYPSDIPAGQSNDVNIRLSTNQGDVTLNYHNNERTWSGTQGFTYSQHANWPVGVTDYAVVWVQVAGSNYHFGESFHNAAVESPVKCRVSSDGDTETYEAPVGVTELKGWRTSTTVARGRAASADVVTINQPGVAEAMLQKLQGRTWTTVRTVAVGEISTRVTFPKQTRKGTFTYRLALPGSESVTGGTTAPLTVRVR